AASPRFDPAHGEAQGGNTRELEARRRRDHRAVRGGRRGETAFSAGLESAQALHAHRAAAEVAWRGIAIKRRLQSASFLDSLLFVVTHPEARAPLKRGAASASFLIRTAFHPRSCAPRRSNATPPAPTRLGA